MIMPARAIWPRSATNPNGCPEQSSDSGADEAERRGDQDEASREKLCSCSISNVSVTTSMIGNIAKIDAFPFSLSSIAPPVSMR